MFEGLKLTLVRGHYCLSRKKTFPVGGVMVMLFVPLVVVME